MSSEGQTAEVPRPIQEKKQVPLTPQLARANLLALYWEQPLSSLVGSDGEVLPGVQKRFLPDERDQTLGSFLSENDPALQTFSDFKQALSATNKDKVRRVLSNFNNLLPPPSDKPDNGHNRADALETLFQQEQHQLNWVPWETFIAYGDLLLTERGVDEQVAAVIAGHTYLRHAREQFPQGHSVKGKEMEVILERQNKDPKSQGILEAVSNSIDAISDREKIGQFGLGVKQVLTWLERGKGEVSVVTKTTDGEVLCLRARKGYDDQIYIKFAAPTSEERERFVGGKTGTLLTIADVAVSTEQQSDLRTKLQERFQYVPETTITVANENINGHDRVTIVGRETPITPKGQIAVTIADTKISIGDTGTGMDKNLLFKMFLPGHGKGYRTLSATEVEDIARHQAEVLLINPRSDVDTPKIVFSRNREADFVIEIPKDRLNISSKTICIELGRILKVSEGRDGFELDDNFAAAIPILVEKTLADQTLSDSDKTTFLNNLTVGIDQLAGSPGQETDDALVTLVNKTKEGIRNKALPFLREIRSKGVLLLPNYTIYEKFAGDAQFVDPYILRGLGEIGSVLRSEGIKQLAGTEGIVTRNGWKVFAGDLRPTISTREFARRLQDKDALRDMREHLADYLPVILDKEHRIVIVDQALWEKIGQEQDPIRKAYLQETLQAMLNDKIMTSYEATDPRSIFVQDPQKREPSAANGEEEFTKDESDALKLPRNPVVWSHGDRIYQIDYSGILKRYNSDTREFVDSTAIAELAGEIIVAVRSAGDGMWFVTKSGAIINLSNDGHVLERYKSDALLHLYRIDQNLSEWGNLVVLKDGRVVGSTQSTITVIDPRTDGVDTYSSDISAQISHPYVTDDNKFVFDQNDSIVIVDQATGKHEYISKDTLRINGMEYTHRLQFFTYHGKLYALGTKFKYRDFTQPQMAIFACKTIEDDQGRRKIFAPVVFQTIPDSSYFRLSHDTERDLISVQTGQHVAFFQPTEAGFTHKETLAYIAPPQNKHISSAAASLKELFGDDKDVSW